MRLKDKTQCIPGIVPGETREEMFGNLMKVVCELLTSKEKHILRYSKRARIKKKYIDRLIRAALVVIFLRQIFEADNVSAAELHHRFKRGDLSGIEFKEQFRE